MARTFRNPRPLPREATRPVILIADSDPDTRALYRAMFPATEYTLEEAEDGAEALGKAIARRPDLIILEAHLRRIGGLDLCELLRADSATRQVRIMMVTAATSAADHVRARALKIDTVLVKPCQYEDVVAAARNILDAAAFAPVDAVPEAVAAPVSAPMKPRTQSRIFQRQRSTAPPLPPPFLRCPRCDAQLEYQHSYIGGVSERLSEQWDYFVCAHCGPYQYRHRTRALKPTELDNA